MEPKEDKPVRPWDGELVDDDDEAVEASGRPVDEDPDDESDVEAHGSWGGAG